MRTNPPPGIAGFSPVDMLARSLARKAGGVPRMLTVDFITTSDALAVVTDPTQGAWTLQAELGVLYRLTVHGVYTVDAVPSGATLEVGTSDTLAGTLMGHMGLDDWSSRVPQIFARGALANTLNYLPMTELPTTLSSYAITDEGEVLLDGLFFCTTAGTLEVRWATTNLGNEARLLAGSAFITQELVFQ